MKKTTNLTRSVLTRFLRVSCGQTLLTLAVATMALSAVAQVPVFTNVWSITNASFPDLPASGDTVRGVAISPVTTNVVFASRTSSNHISTLSFADGYTKLGSGVAPSVFGGTLQLIAARVSDDGYVYACNLSGAAASRLLVYRWESDTDFTTPPLVVYDTGAGTSFPARLGDYMDVRGSGADTEIVLVGNGSAAAITTNFVLLKATDAMATNFAATSIYVTNVNIMGGGVTFEGTNKAIYVRPALSANTLVYRVTYDEGTQTSAIASRFNVDLDVTRGLKYKRFGTVDLLSTVTISTSAGSSATAHRAKVFQLVNPTNAVLVFNQPMPLPTAANGNGLGLVDICNDHFVFSEPNNGIMLYKLTGFITNTPPTVGGASGGGTFVEGWPVSLSVSASGTAPLTYQWYKGDDISTNSIGGATTNTYSLGTADAGDQGIYFCVVTNNFGSATSGVAGVTVLPGAYSNVASNLWSLGAGSRPYLTTGDTQRGMAYDAVSNLLVVVSRTPSNMVALVDAATGADLGALDTSLLNPPNTVPGTFKVNMAGVADDGVIFVGNLITSGGSDDFSIYRWQDPSPFTTPSQAYVGNPGVTRLGDTMAVRGSGVDTEILCSFRTGSNVCLFTTSDGFSFTPTVIPVVNLPLDAQTGGFAGLGLAFGAGNTFWAKSSSFNLRQVSYDTNTATATVIQTFTNLTAITEAPLGVDSVNGLVATVAYGQTPQNLSLWDVSAGEPDAVQVDRELFGSNNANVNGTGAVAFDVAGGRIFALDSNNGLIALTYASKPFIAPVPQGGIVTWSGPGALQSAPVVTGPYNDILGATSPYTNTAASEIYFRVRR